MGSSNSSRRERTFSSDSESPSPCKEEKVFEFGSLLKKFQQQCSLDEFSDGFKGGQQEMRLRSATVSAPSQTETKFPTVFKWIGGGKNVHVGGTFSNWKPIPMVHSHGDFALILDVPEGEHQYKFLVDGQWAHAPNQPTIDNDMGTKNNVMSVKKSDFEVFEALAIDSISSNSGSSTCSSAASETYSQEIPPRRSFEKCDGPPLLPPHLLEVILNKDMAVNNEPILLPEPNHVMLNHIYALSMKDGVMVLSTTHRYKKKYVTTVLYKPI